MFIIMSHHIVGKPAVDILLKKGIFGQPLDYLNQRQAQTLIMLEQVIIRPSVFFRERDATGYLTGVLYYRQPHKCQIVNGSCSRKKYFLVSSSSGFPSKKNGRYSSESESESEPLRSLRIAVVSS